MIIMMMCGFTIKNEVALLFLSLGKDFESCSFVVVHHF